MAAAPGQGTGGLLLCRAGGERLAISAREVGEVIRVPRLTPVPRAPEGMIGLANRRGTAVPVVSVTALLDRGVTPGGRLIVLAGDDPVALLVDGVDGIGTGQGLEPIDPAALLRRAFGDSIGRAGVSHRAGARVRREEALDERVALLAFTIAGQSFALPLVEVAEVIRFPATMTPWRGSDPAVIGMAGWRDALLPLLSLRPLLGFGPDEADRSAIVVVRIEGRHIGIAVGPIEGVLRVAADTVDPLPPVLARGGGEARISALCRLDGGARLISILAADRLLHDTGTTAPAMTDGGGIARTGGALAGDPLLFFMLGDQEFALPVGAVGELAGMPARLSPVPRAAGVVAGVMNLRGRALPVIDLARRLTGRAAAGSARRVIVTSVGPVEVGLLVDRVNDVRRVDPALLSPLPGLAAGDPPLFERIAARGDDLVLIASPRPLLDHAERELIAGTARA